MIFGGGWGLAGCLNGLVSQVIIAFGGLGDVGVKRWRRGGVNAECGMRNAEWWL
jgi:hypothetical protein